LNINDLSQIMKLLNLRGVLLGSSGDVKVVQWVLTSSPSTTGNEPLIGEDVFVVVTFVSVHAIRPGLSYRTQIEGDNSTSRPESTRNQISIPASMFLLSIYEGYPRHR
jgi:hypothetical protein